MAVTVTDEATVNAIAAYKADYEKVRSSLCHGVYPNLVDAETKFQTFNDAYAPGGTLYNEGIWGLYQTLIGPAGAEGIMALRTAGKVIRDTMDAIEAVRPGFFGHTPVRLAWENEDPELEE